MSNDQPTTIKTDTVQVTGSGDVVFNDTIDGLWHGGTGAGLAGRDMCGSAPNVLEGRDSE